MGTTSDEAYYYQSPVRPELITALAQIRFPKTEGGKAAFALEDPERLAALIIEVCGPEFGLAAAGILDQARPVATQLMKVLPGLKKKASKLCALDGEGELSLLCVAASALLPDDIAGDRRDRLANSLVEALSCLATWPMRSDNPFGRRPSIDVVVQKIVSAVAAYCREKDQPFVPPYHREKTEKRDADFHLTKSALLTWEVLRACKSIAGRHTSGWPNKPNSLEKLMQNARANRGLRSGKSASV